MVLFVEGFFSNACVFFNGAGTDLQLFDIRVKTYQPSNLTLETDLWPSCVFVQTLATLLTSVEVI